MTKEKKQPWKCTKCIPEEHFKTKTALSNHDYNHHCKEFKVTFENEEGEEQEISIEKEEKGFVCPLCQTVYQTRSGITKHLQNLKGACDQDEDSSEEESSAISDGEDSEYEVEGHDVKVTISLQNENIDPNPMSAPRKRNYNDAILSAMDMELKNVETKRFALSYAEFFHLDPFEVTENDIVLSNKRTLSNITNADRPKDLKLERIKKEDVAVIATESPFSASLFNSIISKSPYESTLKRRSYVETDDFHSTLLNTDWSLNSQRKYAAAQILAGCILVNPSNYQALVINTVEIYGRTRTVDRYRERFGLIKGKPIPTTLPTEDTFYDNVTVNIKNDREGCKLNIASQTLNALVTSSIRIDKQVDPCVGALINSFDVSDSQGKNTRIFLDQNSLQKATKLLKSKLNYLEPFHLMYQLRQLKSKFHVPSTYFLIRATNPFLSGHQYQPCSIFTLCDGDGGNEDSDTKRISGLFKTIAMEALTSDTPQIKKPTVTALLKSCTTDKSKQLLAKILSLYSEPNEEQIIELYGNTDLSKLLRKLAESLSGAISNENKKITLTIKSAFEH